MQFTLLREGPLLKYKTKKTVVTVPAPTVRPVFNECAALQGYSVNGSYAISGRVDCFGQMLEVSRASWSYFYGLGFATGDGNLSDDLEVTRLFVPNPPGFLDVRQHFQNNLALPVELSVDGSNTPLRDVCKVTIGSVEKKNLTRYSYTSNCIAITKYGYTTTVARHASITDDMVTEHLTQLGRTFYLTEQANPDVASIQAAMRASWASLAGTVITVPVGAFEPVATP